MDDALRNKRLEAIRASWLRIQKRRIAERRALAQLIEETEAPAPEAEAKLKSEAKPRAKSKRRDPTLHPRSKLTPEIVREIRRRFDLREKQKDLALAFGISQANVSSIVSRRSWGWVEEGAKGE